MRARLSLLALPLLGLAVLAPATLPARAAEPVKLPPELAKALQDAQADLRAGRAAEAVTRLTGYTGDDHALRHLLLGHAHARQSRWPQAIAAYRKALAMDATLADAGVALAQAYAATGRWKQAAALLGEYLNVDTCGNDQLLVYAQVADRLEDHRLTRLLVDKAVARFPTDARFRRMDLALLLDAEDFAAATPLARQMLRDQATDAGLWDQLAFVYDRKSHSANLAAALEAALLCQPNDLDRHERFLSAQLSAEHALAVVRHGKALLAGPLGKQAQARTTLMGLLIQAADLTEDDQTLAAWLALVPPAKRTPAMQVTRARWALRQNKTTEARQALGQLIEAGKATPDVLLWAGHLAERQKDPTAAQALYEQARTATGPRGRLATLYLASLHIRSGQRRRAKKLLQDHLASHPADPQARSLLLLIARHDHAGEVSP